MKITAVLPQLIEIGDRKLVFVKVETDAGITGIGESTATYGMGASAVAKAIEEFAPRLTGRVPFRIEQLCGNLRFDSFWGVSDGAVLCSAVSGIEQALWDIKGKALDLPVYDLLGGRVRDTIPVYANTWDTVHWKTTEDYVRFAVRAVEDGFRALKIYPFGVGEVIHDERLVVERVRAVREAIGDEIGLMVDGGWRMAADTASAIRIGRQLERFNLIFYEEPIAPGNPTALAKVASHVNIPIAAGERIYSPEAFKDHLVAGALDIAQPDVGIAGGIGGLKKIAAVAEAFRTSVAPHNCSGPVATAATVMFAACTTNVTLLELFPYQRTWQRLAVNPFEHLVENGVMNIPSRPGLGITLGDAEDT